MLLVAVAAAAAAHHFRPRPGGGDTDSLFKSRCVAVTDGDTIKVLRHGREERVRLNGIDCPEKGQPFGTQAKQATSDLVFGKTVTVEVRDVDRYGRLVADVALPSGVRVNEELVRQGMAWWYREYAKDNATLAQLESEARSARRGLWASRDSIAPWEWRKREKAEPAAR